MYAPPILSIKPQQALRKNPIRNLAQNYQKQTAVATQKICKKGSSDTFAAMVMSVRFRKHHRSMRLARTGNMRRNRTCADAAFAHAALLRDRGTRISVAR